MRAQYGYTALIRAASEGSAECVTALLRVDGIDVNVRTKVGDSRRTCM